MDMARSTHFVMLIKNIYKHYGILYYVATFWLKLFYPLQWYKNISKYLQNGQISIVLSDAIKTEIIS